MTDLIYYQNQYQKEAEAKVMQIEGSKILLDKTIFIPASNTEPSDAGTINGLVIENSYKDGDNIWHIVSGEINFQIGDMVRLELDWGKRLLSMRLHSALHLLAGPFEQDFGQRAVAGAIKGDKAHLVFKDKVDDEIINQAIEQVSRDIESGLEVKSYWDEKRAGFRWTQVGDYPAIPDGGLHVKSTKEIGKIILVSRGLDQGRQKVEIAIA
ncbi:MAG: alanyl-tRNA editing protein [Candidatus Pacebacteria bacterium]|nr:alanyl-tRNA editing protein [Candidatus Paceibacterota bacterium]